MTPKSRIASTGRTSVNSAMDCPCSFFRQNFLKVISLFSSRFAAELFSASVGEGRALRRLGRARPSPNCVSGQLEDAGRESDERGDDGDRDDGEDHAVLSHGLTLFMPANRGDQLSEITVVLHLRIHLPSSSRARLGARGETENSESKVKLLGQSKADWIWQATMVTT